jgi:hypothetical protein
VVSFISRAPLCQTCSLECRFLPSLLARREILPVLHNYAVQAWSRDIRSATKAASGVVGAGGVIRGATLRHSQLPYAIWSGAYVHAYAREIRSSCSHSQSAASMIESSLLRALEYSTRAFGRVIGRRQSARSRTHTTIRLCVLLCRTNARRMKT